MSQETAQRIYRFGVFEANEAGGELRKHGIRLKLHSQPFQVLLMLLERPSEVVTREEMRQRLWGKDTFVDFDHGLNTAVNKIREALGDSASEPRYVETVSGKGYRFIAPVTFKGPEQEIPGKAVAPPTETAETALPAAAVGRTFDGSLLTAPDELPAASRSLVRTLLSLIQVTYLGFYLGALANLPEIHSIFWDAGLSPVIFMTLLVTTALVLIPVRLFLLTAVAFNFQHLPAKFATLFPVLLLLDLLWAISPFLLIHHIPFGLALGISAALVYLPFAQRSLVLMYARSR